MLNEVRTYFEHVEAWEMFPDFNEINVSLT